MAHPYIKETAVDRSCIGNPVPRIDRDFLMRDFAFDLATELAANIQNFDALEQSYATAWLDCGDDLVLSVTSMHGAQMGRVRIAAFSPLEHKMDIRGPNMPSATYDASRPMTTIAKAIQKNLIELARPLVAEIRDQANARARKCDEFGALLDCVRLKFPSVSIDRKDNALTAEIYINNSNGYASGTMYADGRVVFQRVSANTRKASDSILAALRGETEGKADA